jgi:hypothetical protein
MTIPVLGCVRGGGRPWGARGSTPSCVRAPRDHVMGYSAA